MYWHYWLKKINKLACVHNKAITHLEECSQEVGDNKDGSEGGVSSLQVRYGIHEDKVPRHHQQQ